MPETVAGTAVERVERLKNKLFYNACIKKSLVLTRSTRSTTLKTTDSKWVKGTNDNY